MFGFKGNTALPNPRAVRSRLALLGPILIQRRPKLCPLISRPHLKLQKPVQAPPPPGGVCGTFWGRLGLFQGSTNSPNANSAAGAPEPI
jgi:hypothetical protein